MQQGRVELSPSQAFEEFYQKNPLPLCYVRKLENLKASQKLDPNLYNRLANKIRPRSTPSTNPSVDGLRPFLLLLKDKKISKIKASTLFDEFLKSSKENSPLSLTKFGLLLKSLHVPKKKSNGVMCYDLEHWDGL